jgi:sulfur relay (sulfurtransferase) DsrF/TusC family protein
MKIQSRNLVYRQATKQCFICSASLMDIGLNRPDLMLLRCVDTSEKCDFSNLYNDKIFKL